LGSSYTQAKGTTRATELSAHLAHGAEEVGTALAHIAVRVVGASDSVIAGVGELGVAGVARIPAAAAPAAAAVDAAT
jgi:hypothetical protein